MSSVMAHTSPVQQFSFRYLVWFQLTGGTFWESYSGQQYTTPSYTSVEAISAKAANYLVPESFAGPWGGADSPGGSYLLIRSPKWGLTSHCSGNVPHQLLHAHYWVHWIG